MSDFSKERKLIALVEHPIRLQALQGLHGIQLAQSPGKIG
jgi:hypothetical protein